MGNTAGFGTFSNFQIHVPTISQIRNKSWNILQSQFIKHYHKKQWNIFMQILRYKLLNWSPAKFFKK